MFYTHAHVHTHVCVYVWVEGGYEGTGDEWDWSTGREAHKDQLKSFKD